MSKDLPVKEAVSGESRSVQVFASLIYFPIAVLRILYDYTIMKPYTYVHRVLKAAFQLLGRSRVDADIDAKAVLLISACLSFPSTLFAFILTL